MTHVCSFCDHGFQQKFNLTRHLKENKCTKFSSLTALEIHEKIQSLKISSQCITGDNNVNNNNNTSVTINIEKIEIINPIGKLDTSYIESGKMKELVDEYTVSKLNLLLGNYIKDIICNHQQPQNHAVKYVKKKPPTYNSLVEDKNGNLINVIKNLKDSCELLTEPILETLNVKLTQYIKEYKADNKYDKAKAKGIWDELKKGAVKKALSSVLQNDILNDIQMKFKCVS